MSAAGDVRALLRELREVRKDLEWTCGCLRKLDEALREIERGCPLCGAEFNRDGEWSGHAEGCEIPVRLGEQQVRKRRLAPAETPADSSEVVENVHRAADDKAAL